MRKVIVVLFCLLLFSTCKKDDLELFISGNVNDPNLMVSVPGAQVVLSGQELSGGTFNTTFSTQASTTADGNGHFELRFERKTIANYRITVRKDLYHDSNVEFSGDAVKPDEEFRQDVELLPQAWLNMHLRNSNPVDMNDRVSYRMLDDALPCLCCNTETVTALGTQVDTAWTCAHQGQTWFHFWYEVEKDGNTQAFGDSVFLQPFDTTFHQIDF